MSPSYDVQDDRIVIDDLSQIGRWGSVELYYPDNWDPATNILANDGFSEADQPDVIDISNATLDGAPLSQYLVGTPAGATGGEEFINSYFVDGVDNNSVILQLYYHAVGTDEEFIGLDAIILASFDEAADLDWTLEFDYVAKWDGLASEDTGHVTLEIGIGPIEPIPDPDVSLAMSAGGSGEISVVDAYGSLPDGVIVTPERLVEAGASGSTTYSFSHDAETGTIFVDPSQFAELGRGETLELTLSYAIEDEIRYDMREASILVAGAAPVVEAGEDGLAEGTDASEDIFGTSADDRLLGAGGEDVMRGGAGADTLDGGKGDDHPVRRGRPRRDRRRRRGRSDRGRLRS